MYLYLLCLPIALLPVASLAHNGAVAIAIPVESIAIDGDLSDWPEGIEWYPIHHCTVGRLENAEDLKARFAVGYNVAENALYLAVEVQDESLVLDAETVSWKTVDGCELYVDVTHKEENVPTGQYHIWSSTPGSSAQAAPMEDFRVAAQRTANTHRYEWRVDIDAKTQGGVHLQPWMILGVDVAPLDRDEDGSHTQMAWGMTYSRWGSMSLGDIILGQAVEDLGTLRGTVVRDDGKAFDRGRLKIRSLSSESRWLMVRTDRRGDFSVDLPADRYRIAPESRGSSYVEVEIGQGSVTEVPELAASVPQGETVKAGPGKKTLARGIKVRAGTGRWQGAWRTLDVGDGLSDATVTDIVQDKDGFLWFGTNGGGAIRYDGEEMTIYSTADGLGSNDVSAIFQDRDGNVWFAMGATPLGFPPPGGGLSRFDGEHFVTYTVEDGLPANKVRAIIQGKDGHLWFGTSAGVSRFDGQEFVNFTRADGLISDEVISMALDGEGHIWIGTDAGLSRYDGENFKNFTTEDGLPRGIMEIALDREGILWLATAGGICRFDGLQCSVYTTRDESNEFVTAVLQDRDGNMWVGTSEGVGRYDGNFSGLTHATVSGLEHQSVGAIYEDSAGDLWFGTGDARSGSNGAGVTQYVGEEFVSHPMQAVVFGVAEDKQGQVWLGTSEGAMLYDGQEVRLLESVRQHVPRVVKDLEGNLWFGTWGGGVSRYSGQAFVNLTTRDGLVHDSVQSILQDREGYWWFGTMGGASRYDGREFVNFTEEDGLIDNDVNAIAEDRQGNMWFATTGGISRFNGQAFVNFTTAEGVAHNQVVAALCDRDGNMWFGTRGGGVSRYDGQGFVTFTTADGLSHNRVEDIMEDRNGHLWFSTTGGGVSRYDGRVFQSLLKRDGLVHDAVHQVSEGRNGDYWIATEGGFTRFRPRISPPGIRITQIIADRDFPPLEEIRLPASQDYLAFQFRGTSFKTRPNQMVYVYQLEGYDADWQTTRERQVVYQDLPIGEYTFRVQAVDRNLTYSQEPATVRVLVHLPYERVGWISTLSLAVILAVGLGIRLARQTQNLRLSHANLLTTNQELGEARDAAQTANRAKSQFLANMSHEIRTPMNAILGYAQILLRRTDLPSDQQHAIHTIQRSGDHLLSLINEVLDISKIEADRVELNPADFDLNQFLASLGVMFELRCQQNGLSWRQEGVGSDSLPVRGDEAKLMQILINLLGNAVKFTPTGEVILKFRSLEQNRYRFEVIDTGIGIAEEDQAQLFEPFQQVEAHREGTGLGLAIAHRLSELMEGELAIVSTMGKGSTFSLVVSLPPAKGPVRHETVESWHGASRLASGYQVRALVTDDVQDNRDILAAMLLEMGVEVEVAENGQQTLERIAASVPDILFLDIRMPGMNGLQVLRQLQQTEGWGQCKVVAFSASVLNHERQEFLAAGFDDFVGKPFYFEQICVCLAKHLGVKFQGDESGEEGAKIGETVNWSQVVVPEDLLLRLRRATQVYSVTELEEYLQELERLGEESNRLAGHLRNLRREHDMETIIQILGEIQHD